jgi:hypothetical protein
MFSGKFLYTLLAILALVFAVCKAEFAQPIVENFLNYHLDVTAVPVVRDTRTCQTTALGGNFVNKQALMGSGKFFQTANMQALLSPRMDPNNYSALVRYNLPDRKNMGAPCDPLTFGDMAKENFQQPKMNVRSEQRIPGKSSQKQQTKREGFELRENYGCGSGGCGSDSGVPSCGKGGYGLGHDVGGAYELPVGYKNGNYGDVYNTLTLDGQTAPVVSRPCDTTGCDVSRSTLPIGTMSTADGGDGDSEDGPQFVIENRLIYAANPKSRLAAQGDPIRGDLPIIPDQNAWFSVYPTINTDLRAGALSVLGAGSENVAQTQALLIAATGDTKTTFSGVDFSEPGNKFRLASQLNMGTQMQGKLGAMNSDALYNVEPSINYTSFP